MRCADVVDQATKNGPWAIAAKRSPRSEDAKATGKEGSLTGF